LGHLTRKNLSPIWPIMCLVGVLHATHTCLYHKALPPFGWYLLHLP